MSQNLRENGKATFIVSYFPKPQRRDARAVARQRHGQPRHPPPGDVRRRRRARRRSERRVKPEVSAPSRSAGVEPAIEQEVRARDHARCRRRLRLPGAAAATSTASASGSTHRVTSRRASAPAASRHPTRHRRPRVHRQPRSAHDSRDRRVRRCRRASIAELEEAWHKNVFDQFLIDDLTHRVRRYLVGPTSSAASWSARIDRADAGYQAAADRGDAGRDGTRPRDPLGRQPASSTASGLLDEIVAQGLDVEAWLDRTGRRRARWSGLQRGGFPEGRGRRRAADHRRRRPACCRSDGQRARARRSPA